MTRLCDFHMMMILPFVENLWISGSHYFLRRCSGYWKEVEHQVKRWVDVQHLRSVKLPILDKQEGDTEFLQFWVSEDVKPSGFTKVDFQCKQQKSMLGTSEKAYHTYLRTSPILVMW